MFSTEITLFDWAVIGTVVAAGLWIWRTIVSERRANLEARSSALNSEIEQTRREVKRLTGETAKVVDIYQQERAAYFKKYGKLPPGENN